MSDRESEGSVRRWFAKPVAWIIIGLSISFASVPSRFVGSSIARDHAATPTGELPVHQSQLSLRLIPENPSAGETLVTAELVRQPPLTDETETVSINASSSGWITLESNTITFTGRNSRQVFPIRLGSGPGLGDLHSTRSQGRDPTVRTARIYAASARYGTAYAQLTWGDSGKSREPRASERFLIHAADALALAGVIVLTACCLVFFHDERARSVDAGTEGRTPLALRLACLLSIAMALPSSVSNTISSSDPFWSCITLSLLLIAFVIVCGYRLGSWCLNFSNNFKEQPIFRVVTLLTVAGALGGLAYHLVTNQSRIEFPSVTYLGISASKPSALLAPSRSATSDKSSYPEFDKYPLLARDQAEAYDKSQKSKEPVFIAIITAIFAGVFGDVLIGIIAANAVHLLVSGLMYQDDMGSGGDDGNENKRYQRYLTRQNLTVISLGILAGFAGPKLLPEWADNMFEKAKKDLEQQIQQSTQKIDQLAENNANPQKTAPAVTAQEVEKESKDLIAEVIRPFVSFAEPGPDSSDRIRSLAVKSDKLGPPFAPDVAVLRTYDRLFVKTTTDTYQKMAQDEFNNIGSMQEGVQKTLRRLLLARFQLRNGDHDSAQKTLEAIVSPSERTDYQHTATLLLIWLNGPQTKLKIPVYEGTPDAKDASAMSIFDHLRITRSLMNSPETPVFNETGDRISDELLKKTVDSAFDATALYQPNRWKQNQEFRRMGNKGASEEWEKREIRVARVICDLRKVIDQDNDSKADETPKIPTYLSQIMTNSGKNWSAEIALEKSQEILKILPPQN